MNLKSTSEGYNQKDKQRRNLVSVISDPFNRIALFIVSGFFFSAAIHLSLQIIPTIQ